MSPSITFQNAKAGMRMSLAAAPMIMVAVMAVGMHEAKAESVVASYGSDWTRNVQNYSSDNEIGKAANAYEGLRDRLSNAKVGSSVANFIFGADSVSEKAKDSQVKETTSYGDAAMSGVKAVARTTFGAIDYTRPVSR